MSYVNYKLVFYLHTAWQTAQPILVQKVKTGLVMLAMRR